MLYRLNKRGERVHPCLTSLSKEKKLVLLSPDRMTHFNFEYISERRPKRRQPILLCINFDSKPSCHTESYGFWNRGGSRGRVQGTHLPPPPRDDLRFSNTTGILQKKETMWLIGVEVEQETSATRPKINRGSAPVEVDETTEQFTSVFIVNIFINKSSHQNKDIICCSLSA